MALVDVKVLLEAGVHYGHRASRWNPKMLPYIYGKRNLIHIIDLRETVRGLLRAHRYVSQVVARGGLVLFVGTKRQAKEVVEREAQRAGMAFMSGAAHVLQWRGQRDATWRQEADPGNRAPVRIAGCNPPA